jgi:hypothetical protein
VTPPPETHEPIGAPDLPPFEQTRTYTGPTEHDLAGVAARLAPTFGVQVQVVARRRRWGLREQVTLHAVGDGAAVVRYLKTFEDCFPKAGRPSLWALFDW